MTDETKNKSVPDGKEDNKPVANSDKPIQDEAKTPLEKLKASNNEFEKELIRGRELEAERQKLEANAMLGGTAGGNVQVEPKDPDQELADKLLANDED